MDFEVLFLWGSDGLWGAFFVGVRWTLGCFFCGGQMDFGVLCLVGVRWTLGCFFCGGQMDFGVPFLWGSDGLWGAFFCCACFQPRQPTGWEKNNLAGSLVFGVLFFVGVSCAFLKVP